MKDYFLKREGIIRLLSLGAVAVSVFLKDVELKIALLTLGIGGLIAVSYFKGQKIQLILYIVLLILGLAGFWFVQNGSLVLKNP